VDFRWWSGGFAHGLKQFDSAFVEFPAKVVQFHDKIAVKIEHDQVLSLEFQQFFKATFRFHNQLVVRHFVGSFAHCDATMHGGRTGGKNFLARFSKKELVRVRKSCQSSPAMNEIHPKQNYVVLDIETAGLPESEVIVPEFQPAANLRDPDKIKASIEEKKQAWRERMALSPLTGEIVAIGLTVHGEYASMLAIKHNEQEMIHLLFKQLSFPQTVVTFNGNTFDWPFILRRAAKHGIKPPSWLRDGRYWNRYLVDARELWTFGDRQCEGSLDTVARFLGVGQKSGNGADFAALLKSDPDKAIEYLRNDLRITAAVYERLKMD